MAYKPRAALDEENKHLKKQLAELKTQLKSLESDLADRPPAVEWEADNERLKSELVEAHTEIDRLQAVVQQEEKTRRDLETFTRRIREAAFWMKESKWVEHVSNPVKMRREIRQRIDVILEETHVERPTG